MPKKEKSTPEAAGDTVLVSAAKVIGSTAGKIASLVGATPEARPATPSRKKGKLPKKDKHRLPRREKKALKKAQLSAKE
jgi:hypothetical protein